MVMVVHTTTVVILLCTGIWVIQSKVYDRCELALEFRDVYKFPEDELGTWLCVAYYESLFNTSALNPGSGDHGLFQISELFWCSTKANGRSCNATCSTFEDDDIKDDVKCAKTVYNHHKKKSGDGFTGWVVYNSHCKNPIRVASFLDGCFGEPNTTTASSTVSTTPATFSTAFRFPKLAGKPSLHKSATTAQRYAESAQPSSIKPPIKALNYKPLRAHASSPATAKPQIKAFTKYKPHETVTKAPPISESLNQIAEGQLFAPTGSPFLAETLNQVGVTHRFTPTRRPFPSTVSKLFEQFGLSSFGSRSTQSYTQPPLFDNSGEVNDNPFNFKPNDNIYAIVNNPGHSFAIGSHGFKIVWNGN